MGKLVGKFHVRIIFRVVGKYKRNKLRWRMAMMRTGSSLEREVKREMSERER